MVVQIYSCPHKSENFVPAINLSVWEETGFSDHPNPRTWNTTIGIAAAAAAAAACLLQI